MIETPAQILEHEASSDAVASFVKWRKMTKRPLTERAAALIAKTLRQITAQGGDADEALDMTQEHGWQTIKVDWYWRSKGGTPNTAPRLRVVGGKDEALEQIARLAGLGQTPGDGRS